MHRFEPFAPFMISVTDFGRFGPSFVSFVYRFEPFDPFMSFVT
jgi:hypothetical protein